MNFLEAFDIVHEFAGAIGRSKSLLVPCSWVKGSKQDIYDAYTIFLGHMVLYNTRTQEELDKYMTLLHYVPDIIDDEKYNSIIKSKAVLDKAEKSKIYFVTHRSDVERAKVDERLEAELISKGFAEYQNRIRDIDFGTLICEFQEFKMAYYNTPENQRKEFDLFMDDYIPLVYSKTTQKSPHNEDYSVFWPFETMRKYLDRFDDLSDVAKPLYKKYEGLIRGSN